MPASLNCLTITGLAAAAALLLLARVTQAIEEVLDKVFKLKDPSFTGIPAKYIGKVAAPAH